MTIDKINYVELIDEAMHVIIKKALTIVSEQNLPGNHHFYITFITDFTGVIVPERLKQRYPDEMTIVLQYQFNDLLVEDSFFSVVLSFDGIQETLKIPYQSITAFADPSVNFGLHFRPNNKHNVENSLSNNALTNNRYNNKQNTITRPTLVAKEDNITPQKNENQDNVINFAKFKKAPKKPKK